MKLFQVSAIAFLIILNSCCIYPPIIDNAIFYDFARGEYLFENSGQNIVKSDSLIIDVNGETLIPNRCRSKKLKIFFASVRFDISKNLFADSIVIPLNSAQVICSDGINAVAGQVQITENNISSFIIIKKQRYYLLQNGLKTDSILFRFDYSALKDFNYKNQTLEINFGTIQTLNGGVINTKIIKARFKE